MRVTLIALTLPLLAAVAAAQQEQPRQPWMLTIEERIALRTNPGLAAERVRGDGRGLRETSNRTDLAKIADSFRGREHPELFMPVQVFEQLVQMAYTGVDGGDAVRADMMIDVRRHGLPYDFWRRLEPIAAPHAADLHAVRNLLSRGAGRPGSPLAAELELKNQDLCRDGADGLAAARRTFGADRFDRFLYEEVAPRMFWVSTTLPDPNVLRWRERGCR